MKPLTSRANWSMFINSKLDASKKKQQSVGVRGDSTPETLLIQILNGLLSGYQGMVNSMKASAGSYVKSIRTTAKKRESDKTYAEIESSVASPISP